MSLWGGRFRVGPDAALRRFGDSFRVDRRLLPHELAASEAWAEALEGAGVLTSAERGTIVSGLARIARRVAEEPGCLDGDFEDVHSFVESALTNEIGPLARKLHTGRSRNDQVATDLRLWMREAVNTLAGAVRALRRSLVEFARRDGDATVAGYTHLQRAQPLLFGHVLLSHFERFGRDAGRLRDALARADECPLGSGALSGCPFPVDREALACRLGFARPTANSLDAVSDRDAVVEILACLALLGTHLSQLGEDIVLWCSREFDLIELGDAASTGSSLMPQKKNPDPAELLRARGGALAGPLVSMLAVLKGLPSGYNRDLQQDKELLFGAVDEAETCLRAAASLIGHASLRRESALAAGRSPDLYATEIADFLVARGIAFRDAHEIVGRAVLAAEERGGTLADLGSSDWQRIHPDLASARELFDDRRALARRSAVGGTAPERVREAIERAAREVGE